MLGLAGLRRGVGLARQRCFPFPSLIPSLIQREIYRGLARLREDFRAFPESWQLRLARVVDLLVAQPVRDLDVAVTVDLIAGDAILPLELVQPSANQARRIVVVGVKKAREHSRISAKPSFVVGQRPQQDEGEPRLATDAAHTLRLG
ncbi:hypothetical protein GALL_372540 [mine drainage metagenome]|uniref:Uncharacterized protein n=1 Tax=mine drainage metagenome TaxID=410659 RepID=A0A1J5QBI6_9ZZZZ